MGPGLPMLLFKLLCQFVNWLEIEYLPISNPTEEEKSNSHKFARSVQQKLGAAMGVSITEHAVEDLQFEAAAVKAQLPAEVGVVGYSAIKENFEVDGSKIKEQMHVFKAMAGEAGDGSGRVGLEEFIDSFERSFHPASEGQKKFLNEFFKQLTGGQEKLDFRKFLIGMALVNESPQSQPTSPTAAGSSFQPTKITLRGVHRTANREIS